MPAKTRTVTTPTEVSSDTIREDLQSMCRAHFKGLRTLVVERRNRGAGSGPLPTVVDVERDPAETDDECIASVVDEVIKIIDRDAARPRGRGANPANVGQVLQWEGAVLLFGDAPKKSGARKPLDTLEVVIEDPDSFRAATYQDEAVAIMKETRLFFTDAAKGIVTIYNSLGKREKHQAQMFKAMATGQAKLSKSSAKWKFKERQEQEETERADIAARERTAKRNFFWSAVKTFGENWADVGEIWSRYYTQGRKPGDAPPPPPTQPTEEECAAVFGGKYSDTFERQYNTPEGPRSLRTVVAEMCSEPDFERRRELSKLFLIVAAQIPDAQKTLRAALVAAVEEKRAQAIVAWLALPVSFVPPTEKK